MTIHHRLAVFGICFSVLSMAHTTSFSSRVEITDPSVGAKPARFAPLGWEAYKAGTLEFLAELAVLYPDADLYFLPRDAEYFYDAAKLLWPGLGLDASRVKLLPLTRATVASAELPNLKQYLIQEGVVGESRRHVRKIFVDTCCGNSLPEALSSRISFRIENIRWHHVTSPLAFDGMKSSDAFLALIPAVRSALIDAHEAVAHLEEVSHSSGEILGFERSNGKFQVRAQKLSPAQTHRYEMLQADWKSTFESVEALDRIRTLRDGFKTILADLSGEKVLSRAEMGAVLKNFGEVRVAAWLSDAMKLGGKWLVSFDLANANARLGEWGLDLPSVPLYLRREVLKSHELEQLLNHRDLFLHDFAILPKNLFQDWDPKKHGSSYASGFVEALAKISEVPVYGNAVALQTLKATVPVLVAAQTKNLKVVLQVLSNLDEQKLSFSRFGNLAEVLEALTMHSSLPESAKIKLEVMVTDWFFGRLKAGLSLDEAFFELIGVVAYRERYARLALQSLLASSDGDLRLGVTSKSVSRVLYALAELEHSLERRVWGEVVSELLNLVEPQDLEELKALYFVAPATRGSVREEPVNAWIRNRILELQPVARAGRSRVPLNHVKAPGATAISPTAPSCAQLLRNIISR